MTDQHDLSIPGRSLLHRRSFLSMTGTGLGGIALSSLLSQQGLLGTSSAFGAQPQIVPVIDPSRPYAARPSHFPAKAKRVLVIFCSGACSQLETWDYKPELVKRHGLPMPGTEELVTFQGKQGNLVKHIYDFHPRGESGKYTSEMVAHLSKHVDDMCFIHSMTTKTNTHGPGENMMSTGFVIDGFPSMGAWVSYALGCEADNLPAFVAIPDPRGVPQSGPNNWSSGFLPAVFQGTPFNAEKPIPHLSRPTTITADSDLATRDFLRMLNDKHLEKYPGDTELSARIASYELAAKMQLSAAEVGDFSKESEATRKLYCLEDANDVKARFGKNCLLARRLLERGVRFVQLFNGAYAMGEGVGNWDGHKFLKEQYDVHGPILDEPAAGLITDLKARGLLDDTLVVWTTEFGRMPTFQEGASGRDHNPAGFTSWMMGAGVRSGYSYGATDEFGYQAVEKPVTVYDFHATLLHLLGLNHEQLTFEHNGNQRRLTDVHGHVINDVLA